MKTLIGNFRSINSVVFSPNGEYLASGSGSSIEVWKISNGERIKILTGNSLSVLSLAFSPNGEYLAFGS